MTNVDFIRELDEEKLAALLIQRDHEEDIDYDWDEEPFSWGTRELYRTSDGETFGEFGYAEALEHEIWWLRQDYDKAENIWAPGPEED